jgi:type IV secretory pathway TraG/TraD family ATPase VirD4
VNRAPDVHSGVHSKATNGLSGMNSGRIMSFFYEFTHGPEGFIALYVLIAIFSFAGLRRARAPLEVFVRWPFTSLVTMVVVGLSFKLLKWFLDHFIVLSGGVVASLGVVAAVLGGYAGGLYWAARAAGSSGSHRRGAVVLDGTQADRQRVSHNARVRPDEADPLTLAGVAVPYEDESKHFKFMGTTGAGKSTLMRELLDGALKRGDRAVIADPDGDYISRFYRPSRGDVILNPFDRRSAKWNLFAEIKNPYDIDQLARALIPDRGHSDPTWTSYGRTFFSAVVKQARALEVRDTAELYRLLTTAKKEELQILLEGTPAAPFLEGGNERFFGSVRSTTADHTRCLEYICAQRGAAFSVRDWVKAGRGVLFLPYQADQIAALKSVISTWMRLAIFQTLSLGEGDLRLWFAVDELDALGAIDGLSDALPRLRKFGGRCALGFQSISQVSTTYGHGLAQSMVENCGTTVVLRCSASEHGGTSNFASRLIGEREVVRIANSASRSKAGFMAIETKTRGESEQHATEPAVMAAEIEQLPDRAGFLKFASHPAWLRVSFPYFDVPRMAEAFIPAD